MALKTIIVKWPNTEIRAFPAGTKPAHHFRVALALQEVDVPLDAREHTFQNEPGVLSGFVVACAEDGSELYPPVMFTKDVPLDVMVPVVISVDAEVV